MYIIHYYIINIISLISAKILQSYFFQPVSRFKFSGYGVHEDVRVRAKAAWNKGTEMSGIMCDKGMAIELKVKARKTCVKPVMSYGSGL